jgi:large subunit ribosomal protein L13
MVHRYTRYSGGLKSVFPWEKCSRSSRKRLFERVVKGMLPKSVLGRSMFWKLKVYRGTAHPHAAQKPETMDA